MSVICNRINKISEDIKEEKTYYDVVLLVLSFVLHGIFWYLLKNRYSFVYSMSDDMLYRDMVNGVLYGETTYNIIYQHWFSWLLSRLYTWIPTVEWCGLLTIGMNYVAGVTIYYCMNKLARNLLSCVVANGMYLLFLLAYTRRLVFPTYTETVALLCVAAIFLFFTAVRRAGKNKKVYWISMAVSILYAVVGFSWRSESFLMMVPFAGMVWLACLFSEDKESRRSLGIYALILGMALGLVFVENKIAYSIEPHDHVMDYYDAKVTMTDYYGIPVYSENMEVYEEYGISERAAAFMAARAYPLAPDYTVEGFLKLSEYVAKQDRPIKVSVIMETIKKTFSFDNMGFLSQLAKYTVLAAVVVFVLCFRKKNLLGLSFLAIAYLFVISYLSYRGRIPERIIVMAYTTLFGMASMYLIDMLNDLGDSKLLAGRRMALLGLSAAAALICLVVAKNQYPKTRLELAERQNIYTIFAERERNIYKYFADHEENFYLTTSFMWGTGGYVITEPQGIADNYAFINGYMIMIPEWQRKLEQNGFDIDHLLDDFIQKENVLLILKDDSVVPYIEEYIEEKYPGKELIVVDEIIGFPIYNVQ